MSDILERIRKGELPQHARESVVKGIVPLEAEELIIAMHIICGEDESLLPAACETFIGLPDGLKTTFFEHRSVAPEITDFYLRHFSLPKEAKSAMILNAGTFGSTLAAIAAGLEAEFLDLLVNNQVKILEEPSIIDGLQRNPALSINQKQKIEEYDRLLFTNKIDDAEALATQDLKEIEEQAIADAREFVQTFGKESGGPVRSTPGAGVQAPPKAEPVATPLDEAPKETDKRKAKISVLEQISAMSVPQKIQAAIKGDREVRSILIRDSNKLVCCAVIKSPRITDSEVEFYANLRNVQTDILRLIAQNREWTKNYKVVFNLIKNPRTPVTFTTKLLSRLNKRDLRGLERDKGVPEVLRTMAKRMSRTV